jgi:hypothetical protein
MRRDHLDSELRQLFIQWIGERASYARSPMRRWGKAATNRESSVGATSRLS